MGAWDESPLGGDTAWDWIQTLFGTPCEKWPDQGGLTAFLERSITGDCDDTARAAIQLMLVLDENGFNDHGWTEGDMQHDDDKRPLLAVTAIERLEGLLEGEWLQRWQEPLQARAAVNEQLAKLRALLDPKPDKVIMVDYYVEVNGIRRAERVLAESREAAALMVQLELDGNGEVARVRTPAEIEEMRQAAAKAQTEGWEEENGTKDPTQPAKVPLTFNPDKVLFLEDDKTITLAPPEDTSFEGVAAHAKLAKELSEKTGKPVICATQKPKKRGEDLPDDEPLTDKERKLWESMTRKQRSNLVGFCERLSKREHEEKPWRSPKHFAGFMGAAMMRKFRDDYQLLSNCRHGGMVYINQEALRLVRYHLRGELSLSG